MKREFKSRNFAWVELQKREIEREEKEEVEIRPTRALRGSRHLNPLSEKRRSDEEKIFDVSLVQT